MKILIGAIINVLLSLPTKASDVAERQSLLLLYPEYDCQGDSISLETHSDDLGDWKGRTKSIRLIGTWVLYENRLFNKEGAGATEAHSAPSIDLCIGLDFLAARVSSVQRVNAHIPSSYYFQPKISFFRDPGFKGEEWHANEETKYNIPSNLRPQSAILHGGQEWTLYEGKDQTGNKFCLLPYALPYYKPRFLPLLSMCSKYTVRSVSLGCQTKTPSRSAMEYSSEQDTRLRWYVRPQDFGY